MSCCTVLSLCARPQIRRCSLSLFSDGHNVCSPRLVAVLSCSSLVVEKRVFLLRPIVRSDVPFEQLVVLVDAPGMPFVVLAGLLRFVKCIHLTPAFSENPRV